jgi:cell division initiation protein
MKISSLDIQRQKFQIKLKGYDQDEVRSFLTSLAEQMEELIRDNDRLKQETERLHEL